MTDWRSTLKRARLRLLQMHYEARIGHIGGNLSCLDALTVLQASVLEPDDLFILSKGHAAGALYVSLWSQGRLSDDELKTFHQDGSLLAGHPAPAWHSGIRFATGSLGHGLSLAAGTALSRRLQSRQGRIYCLMSDGEWQEGACWEALIFAAHQGLHNLTVLVDVNGLQGFGSTAEVASMQELGPRLAAFGADVDSVDGHDPEALEQALRAPSPRLRVLLLRTVKGHGVSFMQDRLEWHYLPMDAAQYAQAVKELSA